MKKLVRQDTVLTTDQSVRLAWVYTITASVISVVAVGLVILVPPDKTTTPLLQTAGCTATIEVLPKTLTEANQTYCFGTGDIGSGAITIGADNITVDGTNLRAGRPITAYNSWRPQMKVTGVMIQGRSGTTIANLDVNGSMTIGQVNAASQASPNTVVRDSTMKAIGVSGVGPVKILRNIIHAPNGTNRVKYIAGIDEPAPGTVVRSDYVIYGNVIMTDDTTQNDEPSYAWMYRSPQMLIANNYFYATDVSNGNAKDILRLRDDSSFGYVENNKWGYRPPWLANDSGNGHTNGEASPLHVTATVDGPAFPRGNIYRNNMFRDSRVGMYTQGWGRGNTFKNNIFVSGYQALKTIPGQTGLANNTFVNNTMVNNSSSAGPVFVDSVGNHPKSLTFNNNLLVNLAGPRMFQCDHNGAASLSGTRNMFFGSGSFLSCFEGTSSIKNINPGFVNPTQAENGDFHVSYCPGTNEYRGAYPCNAPGQNTPTVPTGVKAARLPSDRPNGIDISWEPSRDDAGVVQYEVEKAVGSGPFVKVEIGLGPGILGPGMVDFEALDQVQYRYRVRAVDAAGNVSPWSVITSVAGGSGGTRRETLE